MAQRAGKVALVTTSTGIAEVLAAAGAAAAVNYDAGRTGTEAVVAQIVAGNGCAVAMAGDTSERDDRCRRMSDDTAH